MSFINIKLITRISSDSYLVFKRQPGLHLLCVLPFSSMAEVWTWWNHIVDLVLSNQPSSSFNRVWTGSAPSKIWKRPVPRTFWTSLLGTHTVYVFKTTCLDWKNYNGPVNIFLQIIVSDTEERMDLKSTLQIRCTELLYICMAYTNFGHVANMY